MERLMPTVFSFTTTVLHCVFALGLNFLTNKIFKIEGYAAFSVYFIILIHYHYKVIEGMSNMIIIDPVKLNDLLIQQKNKDSNTQGENHEKSGS